MSNLVYIIINQNPVKWKMCLKVRFRINTVEQHSSSRKSKQAVKFLVWKIVLKIVFSRVCVSLPVCSHRNPRVFCLAPRGMRRWVPQSWAACIYIHTIYCTYIESILSSSSRNEALSSTVLGSLYIYNYTIYCTSVHI